jgi:hypothetical protein
VSVTIHWQHFILIFGFIFSAWVFYFFAKDSHNDYGIGGFLGFAFGTLSFLLFTSVYFALGYFGAFT